MKIYHTATREDYYSLMIELEDKGVTWSKGSKPTTINNWQSLESNTCISLENGIIEYSDTSYYNRTFPSIEIIEYKAKGEEMKHKLQATAFDLSVEIESFAKGLSEVESDLEEAKSSTKKLIEKLEEYLESLKSEFKVCDYVTVDVNGRKKIAKIDALRENKEEAHGLWYDKTEVNVKQDYWFLAEGSKFRHATPEEIVEYEVALNFHKHGREPFEIKEGDILLDSKHNIFFINEDIEIWNKEDFISGDFTLLKTAEEVNDWLENK